MELDLRNVAVVENGWWSSVDQGVKTNEEALLTFRLVLLDAGPSAVYTGLSIDMISSIAL